MASMRASNVRAAKERGICLIFDHIFFIWQLHPLRRSMHRDMTGDMSHPLGQFFQCGVRRGSHLAAQSLLRRPHEHRRATRTVARSGWSRRNLLLDVDHQEHRPLPTHVSAHRMPPEGPARHVSAPVHMRQSQNATFLAAC